MDQNFQGVTPELYHGTLKFEVALGMLLIRMLKRSGPNTEFCGMPHKTG